MPTHSDWLIQSPVSHPVPHSLPLDCADHVNDQDKPAALRRPEEFVKIGFKLRATGAPITSAEHGIACEEIKKFMKAAQHV
jgi:hypothetical protein